MKRNHLWITLCSVIAAIGIGIGVGIFSGDSPDAKERTKDFAAEITADVSQEVPVVPAKEQYIIKGYEGKLAVFIGDKSEPEILFDVYLHHLPDVDRLKLQEGIRVDDYQELLRLLEDYTS